MKCIWTTMDTREICGDLVYSLVYGESWSPVKGTIGTVMPTVVVLTS